MRAWITDALGGRGWHLCILTGSFVFCGLGLAWAWWCQDGVLAQRGGAIAVAFTFVMLFSGRNTAKRALNRPMIWKLDTYNAMPSGPDTPTEDRLARLEGMVENLNSDRIRLRASLASLLDWQGKESMPLAVASGIGTLMAGFGDYFAELLCLVEV